MQCSFKATFTGSKSDILFSWNIRGELSGTRKRHIVSDCIRALQSRLSETDLWFWLCVYDVIRKNVFKTFSRMHLLEVFHESGSASTTPILSRHFRAVSHNRSELPLFRLVIAIVWDFRNLVKLTEIRRYWGWYFGFFRNVVISVWIHLFCLSVLECIC